MSVASLSAARVRRESELSDAIDNCSVCDFVREVFVACSSRFGSGSEQNVLFLSGNFGTDEFLSHFVKFFLRRNRTIVLEGTEG